MSVAHASVHTSDNDPASGHSKIAPDAIRADLANIPADWVARIVGATACVAAGDRRRLRCDQLGHAVGPYERDLAAAGQRDRIIHGPVRLYRIDDPEWPITEPASIQHSTQAALTLFGKVVEFSIDICAARVPIADLIGRAQIGLVAQIDQEVGAMVGRSLD